MAEVFDWCPQTASGDSTFSRVVTQYGDGYSQAIANGINNISDKWSLSFAGNRAEILPIKEFLDRHAGVKSFEWENRFGVTNLYRSEPYSFQDNGADHLILSVQFVQVFQP